MWYLEAVADANREWMVAIEPFPFIIGRDEDCNLKLTDRRISRHHSEIRKSGDHLWIRDFESTNGTFVNQKAIKQAELLETGDTISIGKFKFCLKSVNSTPLEIQQMDVLLESLGRIHDMAPLNKIVLEINEEATTDTNEMSRLRNALGKLNIDLAFDDFGVGQTRLMELAKAPPDFLKFDKSLIRQIHLAPKRLHQMVSTFVKAAHDLGIATVAEGIECSDEAETCQRLGFNFAQGFFYGRPLPINEIN